MAAEKAEPESCQPSKAGTIRMCADRGDRQQFGDPLDDSEHGDVGIARC